MVDAVCFALAGIVFILFAIFDEPRRAHERFLEGGVCFLLMYAAIVVAEIQAFTANSH